jgi:putative transposase
MQIQKAFKFRLYPTEEQQIELSKHFGAARFVYNRYLDIRKTVFLETGTSLNYNDCANDLTILKSYDDFHWLKEADSQVLQQTLKNLDKAFENFFCNLKEGTLPKAGKKPRKDGMPKGYPKFHSKHDDQSIRYPQRVTIDGSLVYLPKVGKVKAVIHRQLEGTIKNATVSKTKTGKYFVSLQCEVEAPEPADRSNDPEIGIDLGLIDFVSLSNDDKIPSPKFYRNAERTLKIRQRRLSRKLEAKKANKLWINRDKGDHSIKDAAQRVAATHEKIANRRLDFHHQLSRQLVNQYGLIAFEDLNIKGMMANGHLAKSIGDAGWAQFVNFVTYKQAWAGGEVRHVDRFFPSSKLCHDCGHKNTNLKMRDREWVCTNCGTIHDRDTNAAKNILNQATVGATESNAVGYTSSAVRRSATE